MTIQKMMFLRRDPEAGEVWTVCGDLSCPEMEFDPDFPSAVCELHEGHDGMHSDGKCSWSRRSELSATRRYLRTAQPIGLATLTVALILGAFNGMRPLDWALVTFASFMFFLSAVIRYRSGA